MIKSIVLFIGILFSSNVMSYDEAEFYSIDNFEDYVLKVGGLKLNNFTLSESKAFLARGMTNIEVSFSVRNKSESSKHFNVMMIGIDAKNNLLWAIDASPMMSTSSAGKSELVKGSSYVSPGTLESTTEIWMRITGDM